MHVKAILKNRKFKLKYGTQTNWYMQNSIVQFTFFCFKPKITLSGKIWYKNSKFFKVKFGAQTNLSMQNSIVICLLLLLSAEIFFLGNVVTFAFSVLDRKYPFWEIRFLGKFGQRNQNCYFKLKFASQKNSYMLNSVVMVTTPFSSGNTFLGQIWLKKLKLSV